MWTAGLLSRLRRIPKARDTTAGNAGAAAGGGAAGQATGKAPGKSSGDEVSAELTSNFWRAYDQRSLSRNR